MVGDVGYGCYFRSFDVDYKDKRKRWDPADPKIFASLKCADRLFRRSLLGFPFEIAQDLHPNGEFAIHLILNV